jgi:hypothetical protein
MSGDPPVGIQGQIEDLDRRIEQLRAYMDEHQDKWDLGQLMTALDLYSTLVSRAARAREIQWRLKGGEDGDLATAINQALDEIGADWGVEL